MFFDNSGAPIRKEYSIDEFSEWTLGSLSAAFRQSFTETVSGSTWRSDELIRANLGKGEVAVGSYSPSRGREREIVGFNDKISNEDAQGQIDESGLPLKVPEEGFTQQGLDIVMERKRNELMRKKQMEDAKGFTAGVGQFTAGMVAQVLDPVNIAAAFVPVVSTAKYAQWLAAQSSGLGRAGVRAGVGVAEGLVGSALIEPIVYLNLQREQADYTMADSLINVGLGSVLGGGLHMGVGAYRDAIAKGTRTITEPKGAMSQALDNASPETRQALLETSVSMEAQGYRVDVNAVAEADPSFKAPSVKVQDEPVFPKSKATGEWFHGTATEFDKFDVTKFGTNEATGDYVGEAIFFTQSRDKALKYANQAGGEIVKTVELDLKNPLIIKDGPPKGYYDNVDPNAHLSKEDIEYLEKSGLSKEEIQEEAFQEMSEAQKAEYAKAQGYDGMIDYDYGQAAVFSGDQVSIKQAASPETPKPAPNVETAVKTGFSPENMRGVDVKAAEEAQAIVDSKELDVDETLQLLSEQLNKLETLTGVKADDMLEYDNAIKKAESDALALEAAVTCRMMS